MLTFETFSFQYYDDVFCFFWVFHFFQVCFPSFLLFWVNQLKSQLCQYLLLSFFYQSYIPAPKKVCIVQTHDKTLFPFFEDKNLFNLYSLWFVFLSFSIFERKKIVNFPSRSQLNWRQTKFWVEDARCLTRALPRKFVFARKNSRSFFEIDNCEPGFARRNTG